MQDVLNYLLSFASANKQELLASRLNERTRHLTIVLEDIYHSHNASAVIRTADCFGIQDVHVIEEHNPYDLNPHVLKGSLKWIDLHRYAHPGSNTDVCLSRLKAKGYVIVATSPRGNSVSLDELPVDSPVALLFGNEHSGLSKKAVRMSDHCMHIPMYGFTESLNISVSAAICLHHLTLRLRQSNIAWRLTEEEKFELHYQWVRKVLKDPDGLEKRFREENRG